MRREVNCGLVEMEDSFGGATLQMAVYYVVQNHTKLTKQKQNFSLWRYTVPGCYSEDGVEVEVDIRSTHKAARVNSKMTYEARGF